MSEVIFNYNNKTLFVGKQDQLVPPNFKSLNDAQNKENLYKSSIMWYNEFMKQNNCNYNTLNQEVCMCMFCIFVFYLYLYVLFLLYIVI